MATIDQIQIPSGTYDMSVKDENIAWGGPNKLASYGCIDAALVGNLRGNRLACIRGSAITVEYSRDAGNTWIDYGLTNAEKGAIFAQGGSAVIGKADSTNKATANGTKYQLRITIDTPTAQLYTQLLKTVIYCSTTGSNDCKCQIQGVLRGSSTFTNITNAISISGWSGYNVINHDFTAGNSYNGQYNKIRYLFTANGGNTQYNGLNIIRIMSFGGVGWAVPSTLALTDHLYTYDQDQNANFPGKVLATGGFTGDLTGNASTATTATKLGTSTVGGTTTPIYLNAGVPTALPYTIAKSVPSDAKFTDTTYSSQAAASGGTALSLVTTGEKYTWNNKSNLAIGTTATTAAAGNHTHATSIAASSGTNQLTLAASTKYALTAGGTSVIFTTPPNTTYSSKAAASGGTDVSLVTTGEKYTWNNKSNLAIGTTATTAAAGNHTHALSMKLETGFANTVVLDENSSYKLTSGGSSIYIKTPPAVRVIYSVTTGDPYIDIPLDNINRQFWAGRMLRVYASFMENSVREFFYVCQCYIPGWWAGLSTNSKPMSGTIVSYNFEQMDHFAFCEDNYELIFKSGLPYIRFYKGKFYTFIDDASEPGTTYHGNHPFVISTNYTWYAEIS